MSLPCVCKLNCGPLFAVTCKILLTNIKKLKNHDKINTAMKNTGIYFCLIAQPHAETLLRETIFSLTVLNVLKTVLEVDRRLPCQSRRPFHPTQFKFDGKQVRDGLQRRFSLQRYSSSVSSSETAVLKLITDGNLFCPPTSSAYIIFSLQEGLRAILLPVLQVG